MSQHSRPLTLALLLACSACAPDERMVSGPTVERLENPLLRFDVIEIPVPGKAERVEGIVEVLVRSSGWTAVTDGIPLGDGAQLRIDAGAALTVQFSQTERIEFRPAPAERWVQLELAQAHGT